MTYTVSGPGLDRPAPCLGSAIIRAQRAAELAREPAAYYIRADGRAVAVVERTPSGTVFTTAREER